MYFYVYIYIYIFLNLYNISRPIFLYIIYKNIIYVAILIYVVYIYISKDVLPGMHVDLHIFCHINWIGRQMDVVTNVRRFDRTSLRLLS